MTDTPSDDQRPDNACLLHRAPREGWPWRIADPGYRTCSTCLDKLRAQLAEVRDRYQRLDPTPGASAGDGTRGAPGFGSKPPASVHVIAMTDPRSSQTARMWQAADGKLHAEDEHPPLSVWAELDTIAWTIAEALDMEGPPEKASVDDLVRWLDHRLDHATRNDVCVDVAATVRRLLSALKPVTGDPRARKVGSCPCVYADEVCGQPLYAPTGTTDTIRCQACKAEWPRSQWLELGLALQDAT